MLTYLQVLLSQMSTQRASIDVHEFDGIFRGINAHYKVTSVIGHVFRSYHVILFLRYHRKFYSRYVNILFLRTPLLSKVSRPFFFCSFMLFPSLQVC